MKKVVCLVLVAILLFLSVGGAVQAVYGTVDSPDKARDSRKMLSKLPEELREKIEEKIEPIMKVVEEIKSGENYIKGERIIVFKPTVTKEKIVQVLEKVKPLSVKDVAKFGPKGSEKVVKLLKFASEEEAKQKEAELRKDPNVLYVARNFKVKAPPIQKIEFKGAPEVSPKAPTADPYRSYQWYLFKIKEDFAPFAPTAPVVAVIDTGVDYNHEELSGKVILGYDYVDDDNEPMDENGHGTGVAGIIAAKVNNAKGIAGISPKSEIYAIRVLDEEGYGTFEDVIDGLEDACEEELVKIINLSLGGYVDYESDEYSTFKDVIDWCVEYQGKIVVSAAGNEDNIIMYLFDDPFTEYYDMVPVPAAIPSSFTVAATDELDSRTWFSNYGTNTLNFVDIAAPGFRIFTLDLYNNYYVWYGGTSFSAPIVAAAAARVWGKYPTWTNIQVMNQLVSTGRLLGPEKGFPTPVRRVDLAKALGVTLTGIQGQIIDAENPDWFYNTLGGARVRAGIRYAFSNNGGFYTITGLAPGTYTLTVSKSGYVTQTMTVTVKAGEITEDVNFYMVRVKPTTYLTVVTTWNQWNPGLLEQWLYYDSGLEHPDFPRVEDVAGREMDINLLIMPDNIRISPGIKWGSIGEYPYAEILVTSWMVERPFDTLVYKPLSGKAYTFGVQSNPPHGWGKIPGSGAVTRIFKGSSVTSTINSATATGTADFWWQVYRQSGTGTPSTINKRVPLFGFQPVSGATIILVDDDGSGFWSGWSDYSEYFKTALTDAGYSFAYWDVYEAGPPSKGDLMPYSITVWFTGDDWTTTLTRYERETLTGYLTSGKKLFITGQDIGYYLNGYAMYSDTYPSFDAINWYNSFLKAEYIVDKIDDVTDDDGRYGVLALTGVDGDSISDPMGPPEGNEMMLVIWDGDGADNQAWADGILPYGGSTTIFNYLDEEGDLFTLGGIPIAGGIRFPSGVPAPSTPYRLVYLSFGFEAVSDAGTRAQLIDEIITFLNTGG